MWLDLVIEGGLEKYKDQAQELLYPDTKDEAPVELNYMPQDSGADYSE